METIFREYLNWTDWYLIREKETGEPMPVQVAMRRAYAREQIENAETHATQFDTVFVEVDAAYAALIVTPES